MNKKIKISVIIVFIILLIFICIITLLTKSHNTQIAPGNELYLGSGSGILIIYANEEVANDEEYRKCVEYLKEARFGEARNSLERRLTQGEQHLSSSKCAILQNVLGIISIFEEKSDEANQLFNNALVQFDGNDEEKRAFCAAINNNLGQMYFWFGPEENIEPYYRKALEFADKKEDQLVIRSNALDLELLKLSWGATDSQYLNVINKGKQILEEEKKLFDSYQIAGANTYSIISSAYSRMYDYKKSYKALQESLDITIRTSNGEMEKSGLYRDLGIILRKQGKLEEAEDSIMLALEIQKRIYGDTNAQTASVYDSLGINYLLADDYETALIYFKKALLGVKKDSILSVTIYNNIGVCYGVMGKMELSKYWLIKAYMAACKTNKGTEQTKDSLQSYYNTVGDYRVRFETWLETELNQFVDEEPAEKL